MHQQRLFDLFLFKQMTDQMYQSEKIPAPAFFLYFCLQQEQAVENILQHYAPVLKFSINDLA